MKKKTKIKEMLARVRRKRLLAHYRNKYVNRGRRNG